MFNDPEQIEKMKLLRLGRAFRKDLSFDFCPEYLDYCKDEDKEKFRSLLNSKEEKFFTIKVAKEDISSLIDSLPAKSKDLSDRLMEMEWPSADSFLFRMLNHPERNIFYLFKHIKLGYPIPLMFNDFQLVFWISKDEFNQWLSSAEKDVFSLIQYENSRDRGLIFEKDYIKRRKQRSKRYISIKFSLEDFLFSRDRISRYCTAVDDADSLDFALTYRNHAILNAMKGGEESLKEYLQTCDAIKVVGKAMPFILSLHYPSYLRENYKFLHKLLSETGKSSQDDRECIIKDIERALSYRENDVRLKHCKDVLKAIKGFPDLESAIQELQDDLAISFKSRTSAEERANACDKWPNDDSGESWNIKYSVRYENTHSPSVGLTACKAITTFVEKIRKSRLIKCLQNDVLSSRQDRNYDVLSLRQAQKFIDEENSRQNYGAHSEEGKYISYPYFGDFLVELFGDPKKPTHTIPSGLFFNYFIESTLPPNHRELDHQEMFFKLFMKMYFLLELVSIRCAYLSFLPEKILTVMTFLAKVEFPAFYKYLRSGGRTAEFDVSPGVPGKSKVEVNDELYEAIGKLMPEEYTDYIKNMHLAQKNSDAENKKLKLEKEKAESELELRVERAKAEAQREDFTMMNHSIKNLIASVSGNLSMMAQDFLDDEARKIVLRRAKQGAELIAQITKAISLSYRRIGHDWKTDLLPGNASKLVWNDIVTDALFFSIPNMFIENYSQYQQESSKYFPSPEDLSSAEKTWYSLQNADARFEWIREHMFYLDLHIADEVYNLKIGGQFATHLFILFNELFLNAIKAAAHVQKDQRLLILCLQIKEEKLIVDISNSCNPSQNPSMNSHGFGQLVIANYRKMFQIDDFSSKLLLDKEQYQQHFSIQIISKS